MSRQPGALESGERSVQGVYVQGISSSRWAPAGDPVTGTCRDLKCVAES